MTRLLSLYRRWRMSRALDARLAERRIVRAARSASSRRGVHTRRHNRFARDILVRASLEKAQ